MTLLAVIDGAHRASDWKIPLFVHIFGAMLLVGGLTLAMVSLTTAWRNGSAALTRLGMMSIFYGALPGWVVMRGGAAWIAHKEGLDNDKVDLTWLNIGFTTSDLGFVFLIALVVIGGVAVRKINRQGDTPMLGPRIATGLVGFLLVAYLVTIWAMTTKPV
jgi:hypothetical protein